jgi:hypothetical protein
MGAAGLVGVEVDLVGRSATEREQIARLLAARLLDPAPAGGPRIASAGPPPTT